MGEMLCAELRKKLGGSSMDEVKKLGIYTPLPSRPILDSPRGRSLLCTTDRESEWGVLAN